MPRGTCNQLSVMPSDLTSTLLTDEMTLSISRDGPCCTRVAKASILYLNSVSSAYRRGRRDCLLCGTACSDKKCSKDTEASMDSHRQGLEAPTEPLETHDKYKLVDDLMIVFPICAASRILPCFVGSFPKPFSSAWNQPLKTLS
jgi:hypothetical protein